MGLVVENWIVDASIFLWLCRCVRCVCLLLWCCFLLCRFFWCGGGWCRGWWVCVVCVVASYEGHMVDALASRADEGRGSLR